MPAKNSIKNFEADAYYHLYNRGVEKRKIFMDEQDYRVFLSYLKDYLLPKDSLKLQSILADPLTKWKEKEKAVKLLRLNNFSKNLKLLAFCLMPNHFHFLCKQKEINTIDNFTNSFFTRYSMYFNKKYKRVGKLFQGVYKAVKVTTDEQLLHLSRYIHLNPFSLKGDALQGEKYTSYPFYLGKSEAEWVKPKDILAYFSETSKDKQHLSYKSFIEDKTLNATSFEHLTSLTLDFD